MRVTALRGAIVFVVYSGAWSAARADGPTFDVASVVLAGSGVRRGPTTGGPGTSAPGRFSAPRINLLTMLMTAFGLQSSQRDQIVCPSWLRDTAGANNFTMTAVMPPQTTREEFQKMFQNLLVERFHLVFHRETRNFPGYALVVDKGGPKLKEVTPTTNPDIEPPNPQTGFGPDGFPNLPPGPGITGMGGGGVERNKYQEYTMADFVPKLGALIGDAEGKNVRDGSPLPRVVDKTGLTGAYTFILQYHKASAPALTSRLGAENGPAARAPVGARAGLEDSPPDLFGAVQKQLGLRLDKMADMHMDVIVVDSIDKVPTPN